ncbi:MAG TPA: DUF411 domain-containing protein [Xanthomonadaceae bacterium]|nr:DUF411 domain-containing protein [Xanthomonadaceae bacterium]
MRQFLSAAALVAGLAVAATAVAQSPRPAASSPVPSALPLVVVHKSPTCGCCTGWVEHMRHAGFPVEVRNENDVEPTKRRVGVPAGKGSCHTAEVAGYFIEGHVPAEDVKRLLAKKPDAKGLTAPGMPIGSPGMEMPGGHVQPYVVELVKRDGSTVVFARHGEGAAK